MVVHKYTSRDFGEILIVCNSIQLDYDYSQTLRKAVDKERKYKTTYFWKDVTCKECLKLSVSVKESKTTLRPWKR